MQKLLLWIGRLGGVVGVVVCVIAALARLKGNYELGGFPTGTLMLAGMAAMIAGCLGYAAALAERGGG